MFTGEKLLCGDLIPNEVIEHILIPLNSNEIWSASIG